MPFGPESNDYVLTQFLPSPMQHLPKKVRVFSSRPASHDVTLSDLPDDVLFAILARLPIREVVRTSILSRRWRRKWEFMPDLSFTTTRPSADPSAAAARLVSTVNAVLLHHSSAPVRGFKLSTHVFPGPNVDGWMVFLSRSGIHALTLNFWCSSRYTLHSCIFSCIELTHLELYGCCLNPPPEFPGFGSLSVLDLQHVIFSGDGLERMLSWCPLLESLTLKDSKGCGRLRINAPSLRILVIEGTFDDLCFEGSSTLAKASINLLHSFDHEKGELQVLGNRRKDGKERCNLTRVLGCMVGIKKLELHGYALQFLASGTVQGVLPVVYTCLRSLSLNVDLTDTKEIMTALCLFRSSPNLEDLEIVGCSYPEEAIGADRYKWEAQEDLDIFRNLQTVRMHMITCVEPELRFIKFLLAKAQVLETITINSSPDAATSEDAFIELMKFRRASNRAQILYTREHIF